MQVVVANGGHEAAGPGAVAQQAGGVGAVWHHVVVEVEHLDEAQAEEAVVAAQHHVGQGPHHQQQGTHLAMLVLVNGLHCHHLLNITSMRRHNHAHQHKHTQEQQPMYGAMLDHRQCSHCHG